MNSRVLNERITFYNYNILELSLNEKFMMIYFDPPFNSERDYRLSVNNKLGFNDKWTDNDYKKFLENCIDKLYDLLDERGTLFFHISASKMFIPETVLRNKFKFVEPIFWKKCRSKNNVKNKLGSTIDIIFKCNKNSKYKFNVILQDKDEEYLKTGFKNSDSRGNFSLGHIVTEKIKTGYKYEITVNNKIYNPEQGWRIKKEVLLELLNEDRIYIPKNGNRLYKKIYLHENPGKSCTDLWDDIHSLGQGNEKRVYPTEKPVKLIERLIAISTDENDKILDPMCGSGTTGIASLRMGRDCVLNDINSAVEDIICQRLLYV